ncbi:MAG TPA: hypothetical protein VHX61_02700 [Rhizomicrobium sp.]|nr:hypothetical protein [Rhizomicrobium sp.]
MKLVFDWDVSAWFDWGVYGLNLALELSRDPAIEARTIRPLDPRCKRGAHLPIPSPAA